MATICQLAGGGSVTAHMIMAMAEKCYLVGILVLMIGVVTPFT